MRLLRTCVMYLLLVLVIRLMGKRQLGQLEPSEFVVTMLIANLASDPVLDLEVSPWNGIVPILTVLALELLLSLASYHSVKVQKLLCGKPVILIDDGKIIQKNLKKTRLTPDELTEHLRQKNIVDLTVVKYAILETDGEISAILKPQFAPATAKDLQLDPTEISLPYSIISSGKVMTENMRKAGKDETWLQEQLNLRNVGIREVYLLTVDQNDKIYFAQSETAS